MFGKFEADDLLPIGQAPAGRRPAVAAQPPGPLLLLLCWLTDWLPGWLEENKRTRA